MALGRQREFRLELLRMPGPHNYMLWVSLSSNVLPGPQSSTQNNVFSGLSGCSIRSLLCWNEQTVQGCKHQPVRYERGRGGSASPRGTLSDTSTCPTLFRAAATSVCDCANSSESPPSRARCKSCLLAFAQPSAGKAHGSGPGTLSWLQTKFSLSVIFVTVSL